MAERMLEERLRDLGTDVAFPSVDVVAAVTTRVTRGATTRRAPAAPFRLPRSARRVVAIAVAVVLVLGGAAIAGRLGVPGLKVIFEPNGTPTHFPVGRDLFLGRL